MPSTRKGKPFDFHRALLETHAVNERMNQPLLNNLDKSAWSAEPPGLSGTWSRRKRIIAAAPVC